MKKYIDESYPYFLHGGDYNPDQWIKYDPDIIKKDMRLMKLANCNSMSAGIFAWAALEPEEGKYDFSFLDEVMDEVYQNGGRVVLATPSGARPAWMAQKYPEVMRMGKDLQPPHFGARHNHCYTSPIYRQKVAQINRKLAERYKDHPALMVWHLSNEYSGGGCYCPLCQQAFREYLKDKFKTLDRLNEQWWNGFWAHTYTDWSQIEAPMPTGENISHGLKLEWKRFITHQTVEFIKNEIAPLKEITPHIPVTTNLMGFYDELDYRELVKVLDVVSWDNYPEWMGDERDERHANWAAMSHSLNRSLLQKPFMLMESTPSLVNWKPYNKLKRPGMNELSSLQAVAHGSDSVQYFQWRKSRGNSEKFHGAVVDHEGTENTRVFREVARLGARLQKLQPVVGTLTKAEAAILFDWDSFWALNDAQGFQKDDKKVHATVERQFQALWKKGINTDIISQEDDFGKYKLIFAPMHYMVSEALADKIEQYVAGGGTFVAGYTFGYVNENDLCHLGGFPCGKLKDVFGIWNEEIDTLFPSDSNLVSVGGKEYKAIDYCELVHPKEGTQVLGRYEQDFYAGMAAVTCNQYGKGEAYYVTFRDDGTFTDAFTSGLCVKLGIACDFDGALPERVIVSSRTDGETTYVFLQNFNYSEQKVFTSYEWKNTETGEMVTGEITLAPLQVLVLEK